jgi:hypothetical protein
MPDWKVTMTRSLNVNGASKAIQADHMVEGTTRDLAIPIGIEELFAREAANGFKLVPQQAVDFWHEKKNTGGMLYEILSELENNWGLTFGIADAAEEVAPPPQNHARTNGHQPQSDELPDLDAMLARHLQALQVRNEVLGEELKRKQTEYDRNNADIMRIAAMIQRTNPVAHPAPLGSISGESVLEGYVRRSGIIDDVRHSTTAPKKRGRPPKAQPDVE